jgi:alpha-glucosidase (family GH31 glycosyl hydrolase)
MSHHTFATPSLAYQPTASADNRIQSGHWRITLLTSRMARIEWSPDSKFDDRPTFAVVNRRMPRVSYRVDESDGRLKIQTDSFILSVRNDGKSPSPSNCQIEFECDGKRCVWKPGQSNQGDLKGTYRTLDGYLGNTRRDQPIPLCSGLISRSGWAVFDDSQAIVLDDTITQDRRRWVTRREAKAGYTDLYFLGYGKDYKSALTDAAKIFGHQPLPPRYALGYWYSKYWAYSDREIEDIVEQFDAFGVPLDVFVIDMDWHLPGWTGYTVDKVFFPDFAEHLSHLKKKNLKITVNLHPAGGVGPHEEQYQKFKKALGIKSKGKKAIPFDCTDPRYMDAYFKLLHHPLEDLGVDFWWMDWQQGTKTQLEGLDALPWLNQLHWEDMEFRDHSKRPIIFSRFGGLGSGRYPVGFSGDTIIDWKSLAYQPYFTSTASNVLYGYWSHDIGGHMGGIASPELYLRWIQYGVYTPVLRTHTSKSHQSERRIWEYPAPYKWAMRDALIRRYELIPYIYTEMRRALSTGISITRPMYYDFPQEDIAYRSPQQFMFGDKMLVSPVVAPKKEKSGFARAKTWLPEGRWFDTIQGCPIKGNQVIEEEYLENETPVFVKQGTILPGQVGARRLEPGSYRNLLIDAYPGANGAYTLYEDDGVSQDYLGQRFATIDLAYLESGKSAVIEVSPIEGRYKGMTTRRTMEIRIHGVRPPERVKAGAKVLPWKFRLQSEANQWTWRGDSGTLVIQVSEIDLKRNNRFEVLFKDSNWRIKFPLKGFFNRFQRIGECTAIASPAKAFFMDERFANHIAQTGNRMSRDPASFEIELRQMLRDLKKLPSSLRTYMKLSAKKDPENKRIYQRGMLQQAYDLTMGVLKQYRDVL